VGVFARGQKLWIRFRDTNGAWRNVTTGYSVGEEKLAHAVLDDVLAKTKQPGAVVVIGPETVREPRQHLDWKNDRGRLEHHILPVIGDMPLSSVRARHIIDVVNRCRFETKIAPRTVYNVYSVACALFRDAQLADKIEASPCVLGEAQLGALKDSDPEWREGALFTREEASALISDLRIPVDRQLVYGFGLLAGLRPGEAAALRFRHYAASVGCTGM
jgi:integrase